MKLTAIIPLSLLLASCVSVSHDSFTLSEYGAKSPQPLSFSFAGDGVTDDTQAIQDAIDTVTPTRGQVHLGTGNFLVSDTITVPSGVSLIGDGPGGTVIIAANGFSNLSGVIRTVESGTGQPPGRIEGISVNGNYTMAAGVPGIVLAANASSAINCWVGGFGAPHILCLSTNQIVHRCVIDNGLVGVNSVGIQIQAPHVQVSLCTVYAQKYGVIIVNPATTMGNGPIKLTDLTVINPYVGGNAFYVANNNGMLVQMSGLVASSDTGDGYEENGAFTFINATRVMVSDCHVNWGQSSANTAFSIHYTSPSVVMHGCSARNAATAVSGTVINNNFTVFP